MAAWRDHFRFHDPSTVGAADEKLANTSSEGSSGEQPSVMAPTVTTYGRLPGTPIVIVIGTAVAAAATTTMPAFQAAITGLVQRIVPVIRLRRRAELHVDHADVVLAGRCATSQTMPRMTSAYVPTPFASNAFTSTSRTIGAMLIGWPLSANRLDPMMLDT